MSSDLVSLPRPALRGLGGAVSCSSPLAATAATGLLAAGGNAVDAAVGAGAMLCVVLPEACGLGGDALMLVGGTEETSVAITGNGEAPAGVPEAIPPDGAGTAAVPGAVAALMEAHRRFGQLPREQVLAPVIAVAREGFPAGEELVAAMTRQRARLERGSAGWSLLDSASSPGAVVRLPRLADLLELIAEEGPQAFYSGPVAEAVAAAAIADGGSISAADLGTYRALVGDPVSAEALGARVEASPPTSQGILLLVALRWLERLSGGAPTTSTLHRQVRAIKKCFAFRADVAAPQAAEKLLADSVLDEMDLDRTEHAVMPKGYNHTAGVAVADRSGTVVSALLSVFDDFGCATLVPEHEFVLNSRLLGFDPDGPNRPLPGHRPVHTLAPILVRTSDRLLAMATPGADGQIQTLLQVLWAVAQDGIPLRTALHRPRWRVVDAAVCVEEGFDSEGIAELSEQGHEIRETAAGDELFGAISAVGAALDGPTLEAVSDPRREAWAGCL